MLYTTWYVWSGFHKVQLSQQQRLLGYSDVCKQSIMPPHDIVATLYEKSEMFFPLFTGEPGQLEKYWVENRDLYKSLGMESSESRQLKALFCFFYGLLAPQKYLQRQLSYQILISKPMATQPISQDIFNCIPLRIYGDGADAQVHFEMFTVLPVLSVSSSTLDSRLLTCVRNTDRTTAEARHSILVVLAWSFEALRNLASEWLNFFFRNPLTTPQNPQGYGLR